MTISVDINDQDVFTAMRAYIASIVGDAVEIIQGLDNDVPMPKGNFVVMTSLGMERLGTNLKAYNSVNQTATITTPYKYNIQLDFYGSDSQKWAAAVKALFFDDYAVSQFPDNIAPLYMDDAVQMALINGEQQYEQRWRVSTYLQYNPSITVTQQSATSIDVGLYPIDVLQPN